MKRTFIITSVFVGIIVLCFVVLKFVRIDDNAYEDELSEYLGEDKSKSSSIRIEDVDVKTFLKSSDELFLLEENENVYNDVTEKSKIFTNKSGNLKVTLTNRQLSSTDKLIMIRVENNSKTKQEVELIQLRENVKNHTISRYDRFPLVQTEDAAFGDDISTYPIGVETIIDHQGKENFRMLGKTYLSKKLEIEYENGDTSKVRDLQSEIEAYENKEIGSTLVSSHSLQSYGEDIVETWLFDSQSPLFNSQDSMDNWMKETSENSRKRNKWYTIDGPYNKMANAIEPIPESGQGFGRLLLLLQEDRALDKYKETKEHYFYLLLRNSYVDLEIFKGENEYWETEVTSTWLKRVYNLNAPFIDTRFNELIALFIFETGKELGYEDYKTGIKAYADLLVKQVENNNIIYTESKSGYYIQDYFSVNQNIKTHSSLNHLLGGLNILLLAYKELGDTEYIKVAENILAALNEEKNLWIREDTGDLWYQVSTDKEFSGNDYQHLTMTDLVYTYQLLQEVDISPKYSENIEYLFKKKFMYLNEKQLGSSANLRKRLKEINKLDYIPAGPKLVDGK